MICVFISLKRTEHIHDLLVDRSLLCSNNFLKSSVWFVSVSYMVWRSFDPLFTKLILSIEVCSYLFMHSFLTSVPFLAILL